MLFKRAFTHLIFLGVTLAVMPSLCFAVPQKTTGTLKMTGFRKAEMLGTVEIHEKTTGTLKMTGFRKAEMFGTFDVPQKTTGTLKMTGFRKIRAETAFKFDTEEETDGKLIDKVKKAAFASKAGVTKKEKDVWDMMNDDQDDAEVLLASKVTKQSPVKGSSKKMVDRVKKTALKTTTRSKSDPAADLATQKFLQEDSSEKKTTTATKFKSKFALNS